MRLATAIALVPAVLLAVLRRGAPRAAHGRRLPRGRVAAGCAALRPASCPLERRQPLEADLAAAYAAYERDPDERRRHHLAGAAGGVPGPLPRRHRHLYRGLRKHPNDPRMYRHRGHRYITVRRFDRGRAGPAAGRPPAAAHARTRWSRTAAQRAETSRAARCTATCGTTWGWRTTFAASSAGRCYGFRNALTVAAQRRLAGGGQRLAVHDAAPAGARSRRRRRCWSRSARAWRSSRTRRTTGAC